MSYILGQLVILNTEMKISIWRKQTSRQVFMIENHEP